MKKIIITLIALVGTSMIFAQEQKTVTAVFSFIDKTPNESRQIPLTQNKDGSLRLKISKESIPANTKHIDISADFANAFKGDKGFIVYPRNELLRFTHDEGGFSGSICMPIFGMKSDQGTFVAIVKGLQFEFALLTTVSNGCYKLHPRFEIQRMEFAPYEDIKIDYYFLNADASYPEMAKVYRNWLLKKKKITPLKERVKKQPKLKYLAKSVGVRLQAHASKPWDMRKNPYTIEDQTPENEPKVNANPNLTYIKSAEYVQKLKNAGVKFAEICTVGWNSGGHDGRYPQILPIETVAGTEAEFRGFIEHTKNIGYQIAPHINYTDAYKIANIYEDDIVCYKKDGKPARNGVWCGGRAYNVCAKTCWEKFIPEQLEELSKYNFNGALYIDVLSAINAYPCYRHGITKKEQSKYYNKILARCKEIWGLAASECGFDHMAKNVDYINYVSTTIKSKYQGKGNKLVTEIVPFWQIVFHGTILSNPDRITQGAHFPYAELKLAEFGGRPIYYSGGSEITVAHIAKWYKAYASLAHLQWEFMEDHCEISPKITKTTFSNGTEIVCNYSDKECDYKGKKIAPLKYEIFAEK